MQISLDLSSKDISVLLDKYHNCASIEVSVRQGNVIYYEFKDNKTKHVLHLRRTYYFRSENIMLIEVVMRDLCLT